MNELTLLAYVETRKEDALQNLEDVGSTDLLLPAALGQRT